MSVELALEELQTAARMVDEVNSPLGPLLFERREVRFWERRYEMALRRFQALGAAPEVER